jgi:hypothetical protein
MKNTLTPIQRYVKRINKIPLTSHLNSDINIIVSSLLFAATTRGDLAARRVSPEFWRILRQSNVL